MTGTIAFLPPADGTYTYRVSGTFYPEDLSDANPTNYITEQKAWLLIKAALYMLAAALGAGQQAQERLADMELVFRETRHDFIQQKLGAMKDEHGQITI